MQASIHDINFRELMHKRINKVLVICSRYDFFMLEEDGRIDEQIFNEYVSLNLRYPPVFIHADNAKDAFALIKKEEVDLVIPMLSIREVDTFCLARDIKRNHPEIPIVLLTHFSHEVSMRMEREDLSAIDYIFSWLGNSDIFLAIIKMIEDKMNAPHDILKSGVQAILLVEDSIRYVSSYLPSLYRIVLEQSKRFAEEALNEHQQMLRRRGRPKVLLAKTYREAQSLYSKYEDNVLGIISDVSYKTGSRKRDNISKSGKKLCRFVKERNKNIPFLLQSSDKTNAALAKELNAGFLHKYSTNLLNELNDYILNYFGFGEFVFRNPKTMEEIARASDLKGLHNCLQQIPENVLQYHAANDDISRWLNARALFDIADLFKHRHIDDFENIHNARNFIVDAIEQFRLNKGKGIIATFRKETYDRYSQFSRIGNGSLGGKARGLAFMNTIFQTENIQEKFPEFNISIPSTIVISTDVFDAFLEYNQLNREQILQQNDKAILATFLKAQFPEGIKKDIATLAMRFNKPVAIRSSSKLEDSYYQPFAGIYKTFMIPVCNDKNQMGQMIEKAIKAVYASVFYKNSIAYLLSTSNVIDEEKMGIILQEVCGQAHNNSYYPTLSGVARSVNYYPIAPEKPDRGIVNMAYGLGKIIVEGHTSLRFSPDFPRKIIQLSSTEMALKSTQNSFYALNMDVNSFQPSTNDADNLKKIPITEALEDKAISYVVSSYDFNDDIIRDMFIPKTQPVVSFAKLLKNKQARFCEMLNHILDSSRKALNNAVEIEFAMNINPESANPFVFNYLQVRPIVAHKQSQINIDKASVEKAFVFSKKAMGNGSYSNTHHLVFVKQAKYNNRQMLEIKKELYQLNQDFVKKGNGYILIGPGRWGSSDPHLGIPVEWQDISSAKVIVEYATENYDTQPSQGTHFFHNLTNMGTGYMYVDSKNLQGFVKNDKILALNTKEKNHLYICQSETPFTIQFNGEQQKGIVSL